MIKGNKGEWGEFYAFIKLIADKQLVGADADLEKIESSLFPILKIVREDAAGKFVYELLEDEKVKLFSPDGETSVINSADLKTKVKEVFKAIQKNNKTFDIPVASELIDRFKINSLNAGSNRKEDLILNIHDHTINRNHEVGFSIKSKLGSPATLLNASAATNFTFKINGLKESKVQKINKIDTKAKIRDRLTAVIEEGGSFVFHGVDSEIFEKNLRKIDTVMPEILAGILLAYFSNKGPEFPQLVQHIKDTEFKILQFNLSYEDYTYKIKSLLNNSALGMVPATQWDGNLRAHGGVIVVREDGEVVCYHLYNAEAFRDYLFNNTRLDSPGTTRHGYGKIYVENREMFIKLNLHIRFTK